VLRQGKKHAGVNWDELNLCWSLGDEAGPGGAGGTVGIKDFFSDFPEDLEMKVHLQLKLLSIEQSKARQGLYCSFCSIQSKLSSFG
jgi:hypothetical protein